MENFYLEIVTPQGVIFSDSACSITLPGIDGEFGVLPRHASLVTPLKTGVIDIENTSKKHDLIAINWGYCEVDENKVSILLDGAVYVGGNNDSEIATSIQKAKELVSSMSNDKVFLASMSSKIESIKRVK